MKLLSLMRHGKSDWDAPFDIDFDRPLANRGRRDSPLMGEYMAELNLMPDRIVSSPAERARQTAELFAEAVDYRQKIRWVESAYAASSGELMSVLRQQPDEASHILMIGHNPGLEDLAATIIGADAYGMALGVRLPTAALAHIALNVDSWSEIQANCGQLQWLVTPKLLKKSGELML